MVGLGRVALTAHAPNVYIELREQKLKEKCYQRKPFNSAKDVTHEKPSGNSFLFHSYLFHIFYD